MPCSSHLYHVPHPPHPPVVIREPEPLNPEAPHAHALCDCRHVSVALSGRRHLSQLLRGEGWRVRMSRRCGVAGVAWE